jgi:hypothetical protein
MAQGGAQNLQNVANTKKHATEQASQFAGRSSEDQEPANRSADLEPVQTGGKLKAILVNKITTGGAYEKYFGLKRNDTIVAVEYNGLRQDFKELNDGERAENEIFEAYRRQGKVFVVRDERETALPAQPTAQSSGPRGGSKDEMQQQLDVIQQMPGAVR